MDNNESKALRQQLAGALSGKESHIAFDKVVKNFPPAAWAAKPPGAPHTAWQLLEHMRITQRDILDFSRNPRHKSPDFPDGYWPKTEAPPDETAWDSSVQAFQQDAKELEQLIGKGDLFSPFEHGEGQTLLREALLVANHNSYELGQLVFLKRMLADKV